VCTEYTEGLSTESGSSRKGVNRQITPNPGGWEGRIPVRRGCTAQARDIVFDDFLSIFAKNVLVLKDRILGNTEFQKTGSYVTGRPDTPS